MFRHDQKSGPLRRRDSARPRNARWNVNHPRQQRLSS
jgi:hypothetical protein